MSEWSHDWYSISNQQIQVHMKTHSCMKVVSQEVHVASAAAKSKECFYKFRTLQIKNVNNNNRLRTAAGR